jgi:chorismate synthase
MYSFIGIFEGKTTGTPIGFIIPNTNQKSDDYLIKDNYRPSHADYVYEKNTEPAIIAVVDVVLERKASRVVAGAIAKQMLPDIKINAYVSSVGPIFLEKPYQELDFKTESNPVRCPDEESAVIMEEYIREIQSKEIQ